MNAQAGIVDAHDDRPRCTRCQRPIWALRSVRRGAGPVCHKQIHNALVAA